MKYNNKRELLHMIDMLSFSLDDTRLYLDTHPNCEEALSYFEKIQKLRHEAVRDYTKNFGPIYQYMVDDCNKWTWNKGPLPWQYNYPDGGDC